MRLRVKTNWKAAGRVELNARPHPNPLPRGEGTALERFPSAGARSAITAPGFTKGRRTILPLRGGEGRGEGERYSISSLRHKPCSESGSLLIIVLWIAFGLVALTLYFAHAMNQELRASDNRVATIESNQAIDGAARYLSNYLALTAYPGVMPSPEEFHCQEVPVGPAAFWLIGRNTNDWELSLETPAFGLVDEASKLNLNAPWLTAELIQYLPGMTPQIAAAIMDWRDPDTTLATDGAEDETYGRLPTPYKAKNAAFESVEELRLVAGMTNGILYGEDANLNGVLDANENDADESAPHDNRDGRLDPGLMEYFTVYSYEPLTGTNINSQADMRTLFESVFSQSQANDFMRELFPGGPGPGGGGGAAGPPLTSVLQVFLRSGMTEDDFALVADSLAPTTNILVNVNTASQPVLECIPGIGLDYAAQLISYRESNPSKLTSVAWVAAAMNSDTNALAAGPYITTHSYQYTADIAAVGHHHRGYQRVRFVFDTSEGAPMIIHRQDLTHLGWALGAETRTQLWASKEAR